MAAENPAPGSGPALADRISTPNAAAPSVNPQQSQPAKGSWADELSSPATADPPQISAPVSSQEAPTMPQSDGATEPFRGSSLEEPTYTVDVKLSDMQADPENPLYSARTFEELGL